MSASENILRKSCATGLLFLSITKMISLHYKLTTIDSNGTYDSDFPYFSLFHDIIVPQASILLSVSQLVVACCLFSL